jgi:hypothetical protein
MSLAPLEPLLEAPLELLLLLLLAPSPPPPASGTSLVPEEHAPPTVIETKPTAKIQLVCSRRFFGNTFSSVESEWARAAGLERRSLSQCIVG